MSARYLLIVKGDVPNTYLIHDQVWGSTPDFGDQFSSLEEAAAHIVKAYQEEQAAFDDYYSNSTRSPEADGFSRPEVPTLDWVLLNQLEKSGNNASST